MCCIQDADDAEPGALSKRRDSTPQMDTPLRVTGPSVVLFKQSLLPIWTLLLFQLQGEWEHRDLVTITVALFWEIGPKRGQRSALFRIKWISNLIYFVKCRLCTVVFVIKSVLCTLQKLFWINGKHFDSWLCVVLLCVCDHVLYVRNQACLVFCFSQSKTCWRIELDCNVEGKSCFRKKKKKEI